MCALRAKSTHRLYLRSKTRRSFQRQPVYYDRDLTDIFEVQDDVTRRIGHFQSVDLSLNPNFALA
jgi:hypothetical protein